MKTRKKLKIEICMENAAFEDIPMAEEEVARILRELAEMIECIEGGDYIGLHDSNGNTVGSAKFIR